MAKRPDSVKPNLDHSKIQVINLVRTFSIWVVLGNHFALMMGFQHPNPALEKFSFLFKGPYGVSLFFVISGFLITRLIATAPPGLYRPRWGAFYARRVARLFPLLALDLLLGALILLRGGPHTWNLDFCFRDPQALFGPLFWVSILTFTFNWYRAFGQAAGSFGVHWDVLWSLAIEEQFYLFYPWILRRLGNGRNLAIFLAGVVILGPLSRAWATVHHPHNYLMAYTLSLDAFDQIAWGALLFLSVRQWGSRWKKRKDWCWASALLGLGLTAGVYFGTDAGNGVQVIFSPTLLALGLCLFLMGALHLPVFESPSLAWLSWLGEASYGAYLLQGFGLYLLYPYLENLDPEAGFLLFTLFMVLLAQGSYRFFEKPANRWVRGRLKAR